ncbi:hypothetical protein LT493_41575 [Streptomyces tricolor]|nr:hypothetical protein [Streptomyces tricolor]
MTGPGGAGYGGGDGARGGDGAGAGGGGARAGGPAGAAAARGLDRGPLRVADGMGGAVANGVAVLIVAWVAASVLSAAPTQP